jgi:2-oxoglutarate ferredoxin oxidoreductase subunit beta
MGVFRKVAKPSYERMMADQLEDARAQQPADLGALLAGGDTWTVSA